MAATRRPSTASAEQQSRQFRVAETGADLRAQLVELRTRCHCIGFVPTMGNLHQGHLSLITRARDAGADAIVVSIFVNPLQFGPEEDFAAYPRTIEADRRELERMNVDVVFMPDVNEIYPAGQEPATQVEVPQVSKILCGKFRPGHFTGVATVVCKLFNMVQPDLVVFGEKDYQQLVVIRRMTRELCLPVEIVGAKTVREPDGVAMSSRNRYLSEEERGTAPTLYRLLHNVAEEIRAGGTDFPTLEQNAITKLKTAGFRPDYFAVRDAFSLEGPTSDTAELRILAAAWLGKARLIDNVGVSRRV